MHFSRTLLRPSSLRSSPARPTIIATRQALVIGVLTLIGLVLRIAGAQGDLWLDEIWNMRLVQRAGSLPAIFFGLPYDTNHLLASAWLWLVGPTAGSVMMRASAVLIGTLAVPAAAYLAARRDPRAATIAMAFVSTNVLFVAYGSEARGYAGLLTAGLVAIGSAEQLAVGPPRLGPWLLLVASVAFGTFSHLTMATISLALAMTILVKAITGASRDLWRSLAAIWSALFIGSAPALVCLVVTALVHSPFHVGDNTPFSGISTLLGVGRLSEALLGWPLTVADVGIATLFATILVCFGLAIVPPAQRIFPSIAIFGLLLINAVLHVPNEHFARFHLVAALGAIVLLIDVSAILLKGGAKAKFVFLAVLGVVFAGNLINLARFLKDARGHALVATQTIGADGATRVALTAGQPLKETRTVLDWFAMPRGLDITVEPLDCARPAPWLIRSFDPTEIHAAPDVLVPAPCHALYRRRALYPAYGLSGFTWQLYHLDGAAGHRNERDRSLRDRG